MAPLITLALTLTCAAIANGQNSESECAAISDGTCQSRLEETMRVELLQDRYSMGGNPIAAVPAPKAAAAAVTHAAAKAKTNATPAAGSGKAAVVANASAHVAVAISSNASSNASSKAGVLAADEQFPDIGNIIGSVAGAIAGGGSVGDIVNNVAGSATEALLTPITNAVNNTLTNINDRIVTFADNINQHVDRLVSTGGASWSTFAANLNETLEQAMEQFNVIPFSEISSALDAVGASGILPPDITRAVTMISDIAGQLSNATIVAQRMTTLQDAALAECAEELAMVNTTMYELLARAQEGTDLLRTGYQELSSTIVTRLQTIPGLSILPDSIMQTVQTVFASAATTVNTIASETYGALENLVTGIEEASISALATVPAQPSGSPKLALSAASFLAVALAVGA